MTLGHPLDVKERVEQGIKFGLPIKINDNSVMGS